MNEMRHILENFLEKSSPEQLHEELKKGNRPFLQTLEDATLICKDDATAIENALPVSIQAGVSFFQGFFTTMEVSHKEWHGARPDEVAANQELALAA
jgi:hypothetical protein